MSKNLFARSIHDLSAAAWFGGSLMGAIGLNGATADAKDSTERTRLSSLGWKRWAPVQTAAFGAHFLAGLPILWANKGRLTHQDGVKSLSIWKTIVTASGAGITLYAGVMGKKVDELSEEGSKGATEPSSGSSAGSASAQKQLKVLQWMIPVFAGATIILSAKHGEMQRPANALKGILKR